ncbi:MAG TPA: hypothetical protein PKO18_07200 [Chitinophagales bacterium]|nr:hypothetical protein [Chitinophagales bacterium]HNL85007.1 hypothetical protein [Chitinophagales bacterium]
MNNTVGAYFKQLTILFLAICTGCCFFMGMFYFLVYQSAKSTPNTGNAIFEIAGLVIGFGLAIAARFLFFNTTKKALSLSSLKEKLSYFRTAVLLQLAMLEGGVLLNTIFYYLNKNSFNLAVAGGLLFLMIMRRPTRPIAAMVLFNPQENNRVVYDDNQLID